MPVDATLTSLWLAGLTALILVPFGVWAGRALATAQFAGKGFVETLVLLPLILPPTVLGYYLLVAFAPANPVGQAINTVFGGSLAFSFEGILIASLIANVPFAVQPIQRSFEAIPDTVREAAWVSGLNGWQTLWRIELPLAWPGIVTAAALVMAHTLGEFGVILMVGGNIPGETQTLSIAIYDRLQAFKTAEAGLISAVLLVASLAALAIVQTTAATGRTPRPRP
ncbi:MAG: molybdate ABC transporter permease subunit [Pseudomonadota bacterium]